MPITPPTVDISPLLRPELPGERITDSHVSRGDRQTRIHDERPPTCDNGASKCIAAIDSACSSTGLFAVSGHGIYRELNDAFRVARAFFALPDSRKARLPRVNRYGYVPHRNNSHHNDTDKRVTQSSLTAEYLDMGLANEVDLDAVSGLGCAEFATAVRSYQTSALRTAAAILEALAVALDVPGYFAARMIEPQCRLRFLNYSASPSRLNMPAPILSTAHTDYGLITLLATDGQLGLEVLLDSEWRLIATPPQTLIVQLGDMLARWTNDRYQSTPHRVMGYASQDRLSIPFFINPDPTTIVETISGCITADRPARYKPVTAGEFLISRIDSDEELYV